MKKLTSNTFTKGLLKDFHPLTIANDVMTDALNATVVTMNGNEGILQNDMGNGRVESAFLPAGYVPVGMKEYGGIIYVASYNPITNKGQIGSFPSPERNIDLTETDGPEHPLDLIDYEYVRNYKYLIFNKYDKYKKGLSLLTNKTDIFGEGKYIRAGDKFGFYFLNYNIWGNDPGNNNNTDYLSNYGFHYKNQSNKWTRNGTYWDEDNNVYKNNIITLSVQVLDSNNNLRDITDLLKRYSSIGEQIDTKEILNLTDIFNTGYFISGGNQNDWDEVNKERNKKALNTYNNKLYGKLFLVGKVNTIEYIDSSIVFKTHKPNPNPNIDDNNKIDIIFYVNYYYNCPESYLYKPLLVTRLEEDSDEIDPSELNYSDINVDGSAEYDPITNLYKQKYEITYSTSLSEGNLHYIIIPQMQDIPKVEVYPGINELDEQNHIISKLTHLAIEGSIDLSKIGTGYLGISAWKYRYVGNYMNLVWGLEDYPLETDTISDMKMEFYDWNKQQQINNDEDTGNLVYTYQVTDKISYNGSFTENFSITNEALKPRHIYIVKLSRLFNGEPQPLGYRILITTSIYNDLFTVYDDYCSDNSLTDIQERNKILLSLDLNETNYQSSGIKYNEVKNEILKKNNNEWNLTEETFSPCKLTPDDNERCYVTKYPVSTSFNLEISITIPSKFPFILGDTGNIRYKLNILPKQDSDIQLNITGIGDLPESIYSPEIGITGITTTKLDDDGSYETTNHINSNLNITISSEYLFPSMFAYKYNSNFETLNIINIYIKLIDYIKNSLINEDIVFPIIAAREDSDDVLYIDLLNYSASGPTAVETHNFRKNTEYELYEYHTEGYIYPEFGNLIDKIRNYFNVRNMSSNLFIIIASPLSMGWVPRKPSDDIDFTYDRMRTIMVSDLLGYTMENCAVNFYLKKLSSGISNLKTNTVRRELADLHKTDDPFLRGDYYWGGILWKHKNGGYVIVNRIFDGKGNKTTGSNVDANYYSVGAMYPDGSKIQGVTESSQVTENIVNDYVPNFDYNRENLISNIFSGINGIYYKTPNDVDPITVTGYTIDSSKIYYNTNYNVNTYNNITLKDIYINSYIGILKFYDFNTNVDFYNEIPKTTNISVEELRRLENFLKFEIDTGNGETTSTTSYPFKIPGMDTFVSQVLISSNNIEGAIVEKVDSNYILLYSSDEFGNNLSDNFYYLEGNTLHPRGEGSSEIWEFINKLSISGKDVYIESNVSQSTSNKYVLNASDREGKSINGDITALIGKLKYINIPEPSTTTNSSQYYKQLI